MKIIQYEPPKTKVFGGDWELMQEEHHILRQRRLELNMSPADVANGAKITVRQYQRFESGERRISTSSARIYLAVCTVLMLDPYLFLPLSLLVKDYEKYKEEEKIKFPHFRRSYDNVSFEEYKELLLKIPKGKLVTTKMIEEYFKKKKNLEVAYIDNYDVMEYINEAYPFWRVLSDIGVLTPTTKFYSRDAQRKKLEEEGFEIYAYGKNGASLRVRNYKEYLFDLNSLL